MKIIFSLVLYKHSYKEISFLLKDIDNFHNFALTKNVYSELKIYDNSPKRKEQFKKKIAKSYINYEFNSSNIGFGRAHNMNLLNNEKKYKKEIFIIINPDIRFNYQELFFYLQLFNVNHFVCVAPLILNFNGKIQYSAKKNPTFLSLIIGRFHFLRDIYIFDKYYKYHINFHRNYNKDKIQTSYLSGCFLIVKSEVFQQVKGFDKRYFLHLEDADFTRKCSNLGEVIHDPSIKVFHKWARGSHKSFKQMYFLIISLIKYFGKWGFEFF